MIRELRWRHGKVGSAAKVTRHLRLPFPKSGVEEGQAQQMAGHGQSCHQGVPDKAENAIDLLQGAVRYDPTGRW